MSEPIIPVTEDELHAYIDNELPAERRGDVEAWLASHPETAAQVAAWRRITEALHERYDSVAEESVPKRLELERIETKPKRWVFGMAAAVLVAFVVGGGIGWFAHNAAAANSDPADIVRSEAVAAHKLYIGEVRHPIEVRANEAHLLPWLSRRIGTQLTPPDLSAYDLKLLGGRLLPGLTSPAAMFMYESSGGERVTLYCTPLRASPTGLRYQDDGKAGSVQWVADDYGWVVSGPQDKTRLKAVATAAYEQMEKR